MAFDQKTIEALAHLRLGARCGLGLEGDMRDAFEALDNAGVFAALDEQTDYASAEDILAESALETCPGCGVHQGHMIGCTRIDWAAWGDTPGQTREEFRAVQDVNRGADYGRKPVEITQVQDETVIRYTTAPTLSQVPTHEHIFRSPHSDEVCYAVEDCTVKYWEHRRGDTTRADMARHQGLSPDPDHMHQFFNLDPAGLCVHQFCTVKYGDLH
jgi:hypothetical protein